MMSNFTKRFIPLTNASYFLFGPRGTGKSTWLKMTYPDGLIIDLLSQEQQRFYLADPDRLTQVVVGHSATNTFIIDEIQRVPDLLSVVHSLIEQYPEKQFILTGSSARKLKRSGVDLLGGRAILKTCHPFMAAELGGAFDLEDAIRFGLVPLVCSSKDKKATLDAYMGLYLREEVQAEGLVRNIGAFARFLEAISFSHGGVLNLSEVARECEVSRKVVEGYVQILTDLLVGVEIPVFSRRAKRQLIKHSKFYFFDAGVYRSIRPAGPLDRAEEMDGLALEGMVMQHLRAWIGYSGNKAAIYFWRTKSGSEVDFIVYGPDTFAAVEVKNAGKVHATDLRALTSFGEDYPEARRILVYRGSRRLQMEGTLCIPADQFLKELRPNEPIPQ